jgi:curved DNA-binding protein CbpA
VHLKDYYNILGIEPSASVQEIKKAYRKLALQYHPDKNADDKYAAAQFAEIKEAYEILINPSKKDKYLQQRWYEQSIGKRTKQQVVTPETLLKQALELERYVAQLDVFRMDKQGLRDYILRLVSADTVDKLNEFNEPDINKSIIDSILRSLKPLPVIYTKQITERLYKLTGTNHGQTIRIKNFEDSLKKKHQSEKYSAVAAVVITVLICLFIWLAGS